MNQYRVYRLLGVATVCVAVTMPAMALTPCVGDCDNSGAITVDEIVKGVSVALGTRPLDQCPRFDCNGTGQVTVDCIINAVSAALNGCQSATPTDTPTPLSTSSPTRSSTLTPTPTHAQEGRAVPAPGDLSGRVP